ncbi:lysozyme X [Aethina tumida]|uniref:lysozyme X n=1 Tax=Aethina tumida TaxID=116153 RepID=UPI00096B1C88|nr:lysozyme X [Aethina tumida]
MLKLAVLAVLVACAQARILDKCEFYREIQNYGIPSDQLAVWSCIADHESHYDTSAVNHDSGDHGIVQISELYWCSTGGSPGGGCNKQCSDFENDDISDDMYCARAVFDEWQRLHGNGFLAWTTYQPYCAGDVSQYYC